MGIRAAAAPRGGPRPFSLLLLLLVAATAPRLPCHAQFPRDCATVAAIRSQECCPPLSPRASQVCGAEVARGSCQEVTADLRPWSGPYTLRNVDDRERWPLKFFNRSCACNGNFWGHNCGQCRPGWTGTSCDARAPTVVRRDVRSLSPSERATLLGALQLAKETPHPDYVVSTNHWLGILGPDGNSPMFSNVSVYDYFVWLHYYSVRDTLLGPGRPFTAIDFSHKGPSFITWHRYHLLLLERDIQRLTGDPSFALPFWDFATGSAACDVCVDDLFGGPDPAEPTLLSPVSPFSQWKIVCNSLEEYNLRVTLCNGSAEGPIRRNPGGDLSHPGAGRLPTHDDVAQCLGVARFDDEPFSTNSSRSFRNALEGYDHPDGSYEPGVLSLHNLVHRFLNGTGGASFSSANDPVFVVLHTFVDAVFDEWMRRFRPNVTEAWPEQLAPIGHNLHYNMVPFFPPVPNQLMFVPAEELGYGYDIQLPEPSSSTPLVLSSTLGAVALVLVCTSILVLLRRRSNGTYRPLLANGGSIVTYTNSV
ncbi:L-dopachrome tautomerase [Lampetra fluviatilis]